MSARGAPHAPQPLDPLSFSLSGRSLIEASAGTGKTFTIAMLYVRLVLGHGRPFEGARPLTPPEILVVTFTDAATKELRERIRARLTEAAACFQAEPGDDEPAGEGGADRLLSELRDEYEPDDWPACARRLQLAAEWMDEAAVSTIHGWCNRMLREHAFASESLFDQTLETDQGELFAEVVRDYWRTFLAPLDAADAATVGDWLSGPQALQKTLSSLIDVTPQLPDADEPAKALQRARDDRARGLAELKAPWRAWAAEMTAALDAARDAGHFKPRSLAKHHCDRWMGLLAEWAGDPQQAEPSLTDDAMQKLTPAGLAPFCVEGAPLPSHPGFAALATLRERLAALPTARGGILSHAARWVARRFSEEEARRAQMGFDDLLTRLDAALHGPNGERLAAILRDQFPVALIDEFQDTDPVQYRIFDAVYRDEAEARALILIGDPKQAIYAFRGADIHTYLAARRACGARIYTLATNYRSTREMVAATNHCFAAAERRNPAEGAFLFRDADGGNPVPFIEVGAQGRGEAFVVEGEAPRALTAWWLAPDEGGKPLGKGAYFDRMAEACATEMVRLLNLGGRGAAGFEGKDGKRGKRPLTPADMAVLVNNGSEAGAIRRALAARGVRSVYLSVKDSVFESEQAAELQHWLAACAEPDDGRLVRTALSTATLGLGWAELDALFGNEIEWEARVQQFRGYREIWRRQGVLPMLRRLLNDYRVPARLLGLQGEGDEDGRGVRDGERILTDVLHLAELLQQASTMIEGEHGLIRHLAEERGAAGGSGGDARQIRLESDGALVKVVTIHKSKGLEYPLVFLPFVCAYRPANPKDLPLKWHDESGTLHVALDDAPGVLQRVDDERLGEDLRKLYVALTRARFATWIGVAPLGGLERSAIRHLLGDTASSDAGVLERRLHEALGTSPDIAVTASPAPGDERLARHDEAARHGEPRRSVNVTRDAWWIASYSSLKKSGGLDAAPDTPGEDGFKEARDAEGEADETGETARAQPESRKPASLPGAPTLHAFPSGSSEGSFLHDLLEWAAGHGFAQVAADPGPLRELVARRCNVRGWERWIDPLTEWVRAFVSTPLALREGHGVRATTLTLSALSASTAVAEMEFWLAAHRVDAAAIDRLVREHTLDKAKRPELEPAQLNGMLKGFMDLVFEHEGRYYVADYKSNRLGPDGAAYTAERMRAQILRSRYDLQYVLYLLALHRLLKARQPGYDYDEHVGGAVYLFLRGLDGPTQGVFAERPPRELIERLDALFSGTAGTRLDDMEAV